MKTTRGGARPGAGRPALQGSDRTKQTTIHLTAAELAQLKRIDPSISRAIRLLLQERGAKQ